MMTHLIRASVVTLMLAGILLGCSSNNAEAEVKAAVNKYHQAILDKNLEAAKAMLSSDEAKKKLESMFDFRSEGMQRGGLPEITEAKVTGDAAVVKCKFGPTEQSVDLVKVDGKWLIK